MYAFSPSVQIRLTPSNSDDSNPEYSDSNLESGDPNLEDEKEEMKKK